MDKGSAEKSQKKRIMMKQQDIIQIFDDKKRPLYKMCDRIVLDRISPGEYIKYIQYASVQTWKKELDEEKLSKKRKIGQEKQFNKA